MGVVTAATASNMKLTLKWQHLRQLSQNCHLDSWKFLAFFRYLYNFLLSDMVKRLLQALDYPNADKVNVNGKYR